MLELLPLICYSEYGVGQLGEKELNMDTQVLSHLRKIFLAVDGSEDSIAAARLISELHLGEDCKVTILSVLTVTHTPGLSILMEAQNRAGKILKRSGIDFTKGILHGHPARELVTFAQAQKPDLLVVGAQGLRATLGIFLGGVAQQVAEYAEQSVLIVRPPYEGLRRILLAVDGSMHSHKAVEYLAAFPLPQDTSVDILHILPPVPRELEGVGPVTMRRGVGDFEATQSVRQRHIAEEERTGDELLQTTAWKLQNKNWQLSTYLFRGDAATEVLSHIQDREIDLVVAGSRGLSELRGWLMGSFSRKLIHYAESSVLIVK